jgi:PAS domain S-box-containing protein
MSGQADLDDAIAAFADQAFSFLKKPFGSLKEIAVLIERAAQSKQLERENREYARRLEDSNEALAGTLIERTEESRRYQNVLAHLYSVSSRIGRMDTAEHLLDFICQAVVEAGAFHRAVVLLCDDKFLVRHIGGWQEGGVSDPFRESLRSLLGQPLRPFEFNRMEEQIGSGVYARTPWSESETGPLRDGWQRGDQLFLPLIREGGTIFGYLSVESPGDGCRPDTEIVQILEVLLGHGSLHLEAQELREELKRRAEDLELRVQERTAQLRLSEERFSRLVNSTTDIVYITDEYDKLIFLNEAFARTLGYVRENYIGRTLRRLLEDVGTENPINRKAVQDLANYESDRRLYHVEVLTRDGDKRTLEINRTIIRQGITIKGSQGIVRDITEHRVLLQQLVASERLAATGRLAAGIAHEISNPLQAMLSQVHAAQRKLSERQDPADNLQVIGEGIERLRHVVGSMLDLHRTPAAPQMAVNLNDTIEKVLALVRQQTTEHSVRVRTELALNLPAVTGSPQEIQQVLLNLALNAIEAMPEGGDLTFGTRDAGESVVVTVRDTGVGIPADHLPQIFEPFFTFKPSGTGTGLGLYLSKNIMDLHHGTIAVESGKGKGACFTLNFPKH